MEMKFSLFSKIPFTITDPIALIESYCFQSYFYEHYDHLLKSREREVADVKHIGARIRQDLLEKCNYVLAEARKTKKLEILNCDFDKFLDLPKNVRKDYIENLNEGVVEKLLGIDGIGLSRATKILHTLHPEIIPIIDNLLQREYRKEISHKRFNEKWGKEELNQLFISYYNNLDKDGQNWQNLNELYDKIRKSNLYLTKVRIFDILWWSFLKAKELKGINWFTITWPASLS